jgi:glutamyl-tRNA reductase
VAGDRTGPARLFAVGLDHRTSTLELRDRAFIAEGEMQGFLSDLRQAGIDQAIVLSTCDRIEVQGAHPQPEEAAAAVIRLLAARAREPESVLRTHAAVCADAAALRRIFGVAAALESQVLGEPQVLGQVKAAHQLANTARMTGPELESALQAAYGAAKRTRNETAIGERPVTLASAALQLARDVHGDVARCTGLLIGTGELGELMAEHLRGAGLGALGVTAPSIGRAEEVGRRLQCHVVPFADMESRLSDADIVITALGSGRHLIGPDAMREVMVRRRRRAVFVVDLGIPPDVDPRVEALDGVFRYDLDDLEKVTMSGSASRGAAAAEAWAIVEQELAAFARSRAERDAVPAITALRRHFESARAQVLRQAGGDAERATELLVNRLLHDPSAALRQIAAADGIGEDRALAEHLIRKLFRLDQGGHGEDGESKS